MFEFKQPVKDCYLLGWTECVNKKSKLSFFRNPKIEITSELYLPSIREINLISVIANFDFTVMD